MITRKKFELASLICEFVSREPWIQLVHVLLLFQLTGKRWAKRHVLRKNKFGTQNILNRGAPVLDNLTNFSNSTKTAVF